jgi:anti-anti-sigma factor
MAMASTAPSPHFDLSHDGPIAVVAVRDRQIRHPHEAQAFGEDLAIALQRDGARQVVLDFGDNDYLCSTAFAVLFNLARELEQAGGALKLCEMDASVLTGARIIGLDRVVPIFASRREALEAF